MVYERRGTCGSGFAGGIGKRRFQEMSNSWRVSFLWNSLPLGYRKRHVVHLTCFAVSGRSLCVKSGAGWASLDTAHCTVEALSLAPVLLGMSSSFLQDHTDWYLSKRKAALWNDSSWRTDVERVLLKVAAKCRAVVYLRQGLFSYSSETPEAEIESYGKSFM